MYLKYLVCDIFQKNLEDKCKRCGLDIELKAVEKLNFEVIASTFAVRTIG